MGEDDGEEDFEGLQLHLTPSRSQQPPELDHDSDSSEDESMPPSPPSDTLPTFSEKQKIATTSFYSKPTGSIPPSEQQAFFEEGFYLPQRTQPGLISAISVIKFANIEHWFLRMGLKRFLSEFSAKHWDGVSEATKQIPLFFSGHWDIGEGIETVQDERRRQSVHTTHGS